MSLRYSFDNAQGRIGMTQYSVLVGMEMDWGGQSNVVVGIAGKMIGINRKLKRHDK